MLGCPVASAMTVLACSALSGWNPLLLPESIDSLVVVQGGLQSTRRRQTYADFRRFVGDVRIVE